MAYALLVDRALAERQVVASIAASGAEVELPTLYALDKALGLVEDVPKYDKETSELLAALGAL